ncbi:reverse transcriptase domain-containing protein [Tanacetum coccineum]
MHEQFSQILSTIGESKIPNPEAPTFTITTRSGVSTQDPLSRLHHNQHIPTTLKGELKKKDLRVQNQAVRKKKRDAKDERLISILKQIHINLPFLEAMIHMPKGAKVLKDLLSHKEKLKKAASSVKLSEECSAIIQRSLPQKEGDPGSFTLPCLIRTLAVKNALADLGATRAVIDVHEGKLSLRVRDEIVTLNIRKSMKSKHSRDDYLYCADQTAKLVREQWVDTIDHDGKWTEIEEEGDSNKENDQLPVVISSALSAVEKARLLEVLKNHKGVIASSVADIKGIDSSFCTHKILMEDEFKPSVQPERRVNPNIKEVVPKKWGMTVVKNEKNELISQRTVTGWRVCIDYRKLNNATRKDHFPLSFIGQMLERLAGHEYYCFLDGVLGYFHILIALEDQEKTIFTCPYGTFAYRRMPFGLCNAPATFQRCMTAIFHELIEDSMEVFMDDFSVFGSSFSTVLLPQETF